MVYQDKFYLVGGNTIGHDGGFVNWFDEYDPKNNTWTVLENAPQARDHFHAAIIDNTLYAPGGRQSGGESGVFGPLPSIVDTYDFDTKKWAELEKPLPTPRAAPGIIVFNNELLVMGGEGEEPGPAYKLVEAYNPTTGNWSRKADMNYARHGTQAILSGNGIYVAGGSPNRGGGNQLNMEVYNKDDPQGEAITASKLDTPLGISIESGATKKIVINNRGGNTSSFIRSAEITGSEKDNFQINSDVDLTLVGANEQFEIEIKHLGKNAYESAVLRIVYNEDIEKEIKLFSE